MERQDFFGNKQTLEPLLFKPVYKDYLWGGTRIAERFGRTDVPLFCAESWELTDRPEGMSVVESGPFAGHTLSELVRSLGESLLGRGKQVLRFPLLVKLIDAKQRLSLQVHPDEAAARRTGTDAKNEMWYVLAGTPNASVSIGFRHCMDGETLEEIVKTRQDVRMESLLYRYPAVEGSAFFIPGGCAHAIEAGCLILEVQQNSDTTYRLWDWNRVGPDGKRRELHLTEALDAIDWNAEPTLFQNPSPTENAPTEAERVVVTPFFAVERYRTSEKIDLDTEGNRFDILFSARSEAVLCFTTRGMSKELIIPEGRTCLIPAAVGTYHIAASHHPREILRIF